MKSKIGILGLFLILGCSLKPSKRMGVDKKFVKDSMDVEFQGQLERASILDSSSMGDLNLLSSVSYIGSEKGYHVFFQWSKVAPPPYNVTLFALDSTFCKLETTYPIQKGTKKLGDEEPRKYLRATFKNKECFDGEPN